jgi:colanic acid/amylovoran biosynthesis glycosyltransferase
VAVRVAYLTGRYPAVTHTFVLREVRALRRLGVDVETFSIWRSGEGDLLSEADREEWQRTDALLPPSPGRLLRAHLRGFAHAPAAYVGTLRRALALSSAGLRQRVLGLTWFVDAILLWDACRTRGLRHVHAHLDGTAPMVALLAVEFANAGRRARESWSWSQTVHGSKEFYDVRRERLAVRAASASFLACISDFTRSQVMAFVPEELWDKLVVVRCGVDTDDFAPQARRPAGTPQILTIGRVDPMKGKVVLLHALALLAEGGPRPGLIFVGDGPSRATAVAVAEQLGLSDRVTFVGAVAGDRIRDYYAACDVFCLPSFAEGVPIVLMEAMAMEIPVVTTAIGGIPELVEDAVSGFLVRPGRADELADRLARLLRDPELRSALGRAGRRRVESEYNVHRNARELARLFADRAPGAVSMSASEARGIARPDDAQPQPHGERREERGRNGVRDHEVEDQHG